MKLVILDRDGVINEDRDDYVKSPAEWQPITGSLEAIVRLKHAGFMVVVASNQSGIARGLFDYEALFAIHDKMKRMLAELGAQVDGIFFCSHHPDAGCPCRKPETGMFEDISRRIGRSLRGSSVVGDRRSDIEPAIAVGAYPILIRSGGDRANRGPGLNDATTCRNLAEAADRIIDLDETATEKPKRVVSRDP